MSDAAAAGGVSDAAAAGGASATRPRSAALDAVRVLAIAAVIVGHAVPDEGFRQYLFAWHVPVFFFLSGYLWREDRAIGKELGTRWRTLAVPYLFWLAMIGVVYVVLTLSGYFSPAPSVADFLGPLLGGANAREPFTTFYFVSVLFFVAVLMRLIMPLPEWLKWLIAAAGLTAGYLIGPLLAFTPLAIGSAIPCLVFVMAGRMIRPLAERIGRAVPFVPMSIGLALVVVGEALVWGGVVEPVDIKLGHFGTPVTSVLVACGISVGLVLVANAVYRRAPARVSATTTTLSLAGLVAVLVHPLVQWMLRPFDAPLWGFIAVMLVVPWAIGIGIRHTTLAPTATGGPRAGAPSAAGM